MNLRSAATAAMLGMATMISPLMLSSAHADGLYSGTVTGFFSNPVATGNLILIDGSSAYFDNTATAVTNGFPGDYAAWGTNPGQSQLLFVGTNFTDIAPEQVFHIGTVYYNNGTSALETLIFGAQLHLLTGGVTDEHVSDLNILTTQNTGLGDARDSDFIGFSDFDSTFNVIEGGTASVELFGRIIGDPMLTIDYIEISPGAAGLGFVGNGIGAIPEPATWLSMILGLFGLGAALRARRTVLAA